MPVIVIILIKESGKHHGQQGTRADNKKDTTGISS